MLYSRYIPSYQLSSIIRAHGQYCTWRWELPIILARQRFWIMWDLATIARNMAFVTTCSNHTVHALNCFLAYPYPYILSDHILSIGRYWELSYLSCNCPAWRILKLVDFFFRLFLHQPTPEYTQKTVRLAEKPVG